MSVRQYIALSSFLAFSLLMVAIRVHAVEPQAILDRIETVSVYGSYFLAAMIGSFLAGEFRHSIRRRLWRRF